MCTIYRTILLLIYIRHSFCIICIHNDGRKGDTTVEKKYYKVAAYPMKIRLYPTIGQAKTIDAWFLGLQKAYNMTLYALREGTPELRQKSANSNAEFPNWRYICSQSWLNYLRSKSPVVASVPANGLSSSVGGILNVDIRKAWESQGKLPIDSWFQATDAKGHPIVRWYSDRKPRRSCYLQINADKFQRQNDSIYYATQRFPGQSPRME